MNAAGTCKNISEFVRLCLTEDIGAILLGSITLKERAGNPGNVYHETPVGSLNSIGMSNLGLEKYRLLIPKFADEAHQHKKKLGVSIAAVESLEEYWQIAEEVIALGADFIEINCGCPNVWDNGRQHRILTFDLKAMEKILATLKYLDFPFSVKVSPISDPIYIQELAALITKCNNITAVTAINTFPNGNDRDEKGNNAISGAGFGGVSGEALALIGKGQVYQWRQCLNPDIQIIAAGGISTGKDMRDYRLNGASLFQIGTAFLNKGPEIFGQVMAEAEILKETETV